jgi:hypothetical protein
VASVGYCGSLLLQDRLVELTPAGLRGHSLGLHSSGMFTMQAVGATLAGAIAQALPAGRAMAVLAVASIAVSALLARALHRPLPPAPAPAAVPAPPPEPAAGDPEGHVTADR